MAWQPARRSGTAGFRRFLAVPFRTDGRIEPARRGVLMDQHLSHWLAEWLLRLMERYVHERARVRILSELALHLPERERRAALTGALVAALGIPDERARADALCGLAQHLPSAPLADALAAASEVFANAKLREIAPPLA